MRQRIGVGVTPDFEAGGVGHGRPMPCREVVEDDDLVPGVHDGVDRDRPDIARAARHEDAHATLPSARVIARVAFD